MPKGPRVLPYSFNPLPSPKQGETWHLVPFCVPRLGFNPLPSPKQGETASRLLRFTKISVSIRSPHRSKGRLIKSLAQPGEDMVSIRSPHRSKGRPEGDIAHIFAKLFQSAPLTEARGDYRGWLEDNNNVEFQSAPLTEARGDLITEAAVASPQKVSIRSPHRSKGRREPCIGRGSRGTGFNPLPSPKQGETRVAVISPGAMSCFNPLPSPKQGETACAKLLSPRSPVSIRSPHRSKGRRSLCHYAKPPARFQSAPLTEARGDVPAPTSSFFCPLFQSAPLTEARGDPQPQPQPQPSPQFQSAPLTEARGDCKPYTECLPHQGFNPLPSPKQGETQVHGRGGPAVAVSIRSPHRSKGRPTAWSSRSCTSRFQSAPLTEARGDVEDHEVQMTAYKFQSAPLTEARGDAGRYNQRNNKNLHRHMRDSVK